MASGWLICPCAVGVEQARGAMVSGCGSWVVSLGRVRVVVKGKARSASRSVGRLWWAGWLGGRTRCLGARAPKCVC